GVLTHGPETPAIHGGLDAPGVGRLSRVSSLPVIIPPPKIGLGIQLVNWNVGRGFWVRGIADFGYVRHEELCLSTRFPERTDSKPAKHKRETGSLGNSPAGPAACMVGRVLSKQEDNSNSRERQENKARDLKPELMQRGTEVGKHCSCTIDH